MTTHGTNLEKLSALKKGRYIQLTRRQPITLFWRELNLLFTRLKEKLNGKLAWIQHCKKAKFADIQAKNKASPCKNKI